MYNSAKLAHWVCSYSIQSVVPTLLQKLLTLREVCSLDGSSIKVVGTPIYWANNFRSNGDSPFDFIGTTKTNTLSDTKSRMQVLTRVGLARFVTKKVSVKKCEFICRYLSILFFVEKLWDRLPSVSCCFNLVVIYKVLRTVSTSIRHTLAKSTDFTPFGRSAWTADTLTMVRYSNKAPTSINPMLVVVLPINITNFYWAGWFLSD